MVGVRFPRGESMNEFFNSDIAKVLSKANWGRDRGPNFAFLIFFVVWGILTVLGWVILAWRKITFRVPPGLVWRKEGEGVIWFSVWGATLDDWANGGSVEVSVHMVRMVLVVLGRWCYSRKWVWNLRTKLCFVASWKQNVLDTFMRELRSSGPMKFVVIQIIVILIRGYHL